MPVYESIKNADNRIKISEQNKDSVVFGWNEGIRMLARQCSGGAKNIALDGWYGVDFEKIAYALETELKAMGLEVRLLDALELYKTREEIAAYNAQYVTEDPGFGIVNAKGVIEDILEPESVAAMQGKLAHKSGQVTVIYGTGACVRELAPLIDVKCYVDNTHQKVQWDMWTGKLKSFGSAQAVSYTHLDVYKRQQRSCMRK